jgi:hypothetical protein
LLTEEAVMALQTEAKNGTLPEGYYLSDTEGLSLSVKELPESLCQHANFFDLLFQAQYWNGDVVHMRTMLEQLLRRQSLIPDETAKNWLLQEPIADKIQYLQRILNANRDDIPSQDLPSMIRWVSDKGTVFGITEAHMKEIQKRLMQAPAQAPVPNNALEFQAPLAFGTKRSSPGSETVPPSSNNPKSPSA